MTYSYFSLGSSNITTFAVQKSESMRKQYLSAPLPFQGQKRMFAMKYVTCFTDLKKETLYNKVKSANYPLCSGYLDGLTITSCDYKEIFEKYKDVPGVVFLVDPPYLSTDNTTYKMYWKLPDYLDVLTVLSGHRFIYFTSNKSSIVELCEWIGRNKLIGNPFENCNRREFNAHMNYNASYTDIMLYTDIA